MQKIDRLGWAAGVAFAIQGEKIGIRVNDPVSLEPIHRLLPAGCKRLKRREVDHLYSVWLAPPSRRAGTRSFNLLYAGVQRLARTLEGNEVMDVLANDLELRLAERAASVGKLAWPHQLVFESFGVRLGVRSNDAELMEQATPYLPPGWKLSELKTADHWFSLRRSGVVPAGCLLLHSGNTRMGQTNDPGLLLEGLEGEVQLYIAEFAPAYVFLHAGVIVWNGRALLLPGRSMSGKSTLVAALLGAGATYYSDEFAVLDENGLVHAYPRRLSLRQPGARPIRPAAADLGSHNGGLPLPVALVALLQHVPGGTCSPRALSGGAAIVELLQHTVPARRRPYAALDALHRMIVHARCLKGTRGEAREAARFLLRELESTPTLNHVA